MEQERYIDIDLIKRGRWQPRRDFNQVALEELAHSIEASGVIQPIVVRFDKKDGLYEIIAGERRWRATQLAGEYRVPAIVRNDLDDAAARALSLVENIQREDLDPIEEAEGIRALIKQCELSHTEAAKRVGKSRPFVSNALRLLELNPVVQGLIKKKQLDTGHGKALLALNDQWQLNLANMAAHRGWSVRKLEARVAEIRDMINGTFTPDEAAARDPNLVALENQLQNKFGQKFTVDFDPDKGKGRVVIKYHTLEELQGLLESWGVNHSA